MLGRAIKGERFIVVRSSVNEVPYKRERASHGTVPNHERYRRSLLFTERKKPRCELSRNVTIKADEIDDPLAKERGQQQRRIIGRFSEPFRLVDQRSHLSHGSLGFGRAISFDMHERVQERDL